MPNVNYRQLDARSFQIVGSNLVSSGIASQFGYYVVVDPSVIEGLGGTPSSTISAGTLAASALKQSNFDPAQPAADFSAANWVSKGWNDPANLENFKTQLSTWITNNLMNSTVNPGSNDFNFYLLDGTYSGTRYLVPIVYCGTDKEVTVDSDAEAFFTAAGITDTTQKTAVNKLVLDLKGYSIWTKLLAIYPFVGGTYNTCKYNLKDPRDVDAAYRLTEINGYAMSYSSNGIAGTNGQLDTKLAFNVLDYNNASISMYIRQPMAAINGAAIGTDGQVFIGKRLAGSILQLAIGGSYGTAAFGDANSGTNPAGFITGGTNGSRLTKLWANGVLGATGTGTATATSETIKLLNSSNQTTNGVTISFVSVGGNLSDSQHVDFYTAVQAFQTTLGRQV